MTSAAVPSGSSPQNQPIPPQKNNDVSSVLLSVAQSAGAGAIAGGVARSVSNFGYNMGASVQCGEGMRLPNRENFRRVAVSGVTSAFVAHATTYGTKAYTSKVTEPGSREAI